ncbi:hypothetical protein WDW86_05735 [Bdellovibrionota bacterium FG-2]
MKNMNPLLFVCAVGIAVILEIGAFATESGLRHLKLAQDPPKNWNLGGTLQDVKMKKWVKAPYWNRLATSADWILVLLKEIDKEKAVELEACVSEVGKGKKSSFLNAQTTMGVAFSCAVFMGYAKGESDEQ